MRRFLSIQKQLHVLQKIIYYFENLTHVHPENCRWSIKEQELLRKTILSMISILRNNCSEIGYQHYRLIDELDQQFWNHKSDLAEHKTHDYHHHFSSESIILFEVLSIHDMLEELERVCEKYEGKKKAL